MPRQFGVAVFVAVLCLTLDALAADPPPIVVSHGEAAGTYQAFPDVCRLANGDLLCVFYAGYTHISLPKEGWPKGGRIAMSRSTDEGRTWSEAQVLFDGPLDDRDPSVAQMRDGTVVCNFFVRPVDPQTKAARTDVCLVTSRDGGRTWDAEPRVVCAGWACSSPVRELADGTRLLGVYGKPPNDPKECGGVIRSTDGGKTWSPPVPIGSGSGVQLDAETDVITLKDESLYAALRSPKEMYFATSNDRGLTWSAVKPIGFPGHCPYFLRVGTGEILLAHRLPKTALHVSRDEAKTWQGPIAIDDCIGAYPSMVSLKDGSVLVVYYVEGAGSVIRAKRLRVTAAGFEFLPLDVANDPRRPATHPPG